MMSESSIVIAQKFVRAINHHDVDAIAGLMTEEHRFIDSLGNVVKGREAIRAGWAGYFKMVPDYPIAIEEAYGDGPITMLLGTANGTYAANGELKPENRRTTPVALRAFVEDAKVAEWHVYADNDPIRKRLAKPR